MNRTNSNKQAPANNAAGASKSSPGVQAGARNNQPTTTNHRQAARPAPAAGKSRLAQQTAGGNIGAATQQQQFQQKFVTNQQMPQIINAPTSLTNLAQLSGITLLPIANTSRLLQTNTATMSPMPRATTSSAAINKNTPQQQQLQSSRQKPVAGGQSKPTSNIAVPASSSSSLNISNNHYHHTNNPYDQQKFIKIHSTQQPVYNIATIPSSYQLLNQSSFNNISLNESMTNSWVNATATTTIGNEPIQFSPQQPIIQTQKSKHNNSWATNNRKQTKVQNSNQLTKNQLSLPLASSSASSSDNDFQVISITDGLPPITGELSDLHTTQSTINNFNDILSQPSIESLDESGIDVNGDLNKISLMKLLAILNNPALTVTAVGSDRNPIGSNSRLSPPPMDDHLHQHQQLPSQAALNLIDNRQISITMPNNNDISYNQFENDYVQEAFIAEQRIDMQPRTRVPKSTANLQMIQKASVNPTLPNSKRNQTYSRNPSINSSRDQPSTLPQNDHKQLDLQLNWLPNYGKATNSTNHTAPAPWLTGRLDSTNEQEENDKMNDPTLLSTSVRNLMMQQLPSSTKNPTDSVHLLKHIADQTKDNNWTSNQTQKSLLEPECIISSPRSLPQVVTNQAKQVETSKIVRSSHVPKKLAKNPLQSSKSRLYIPRSNCLPSKHDGAAVSEPRFKLHDIIIDDGDSREVLISERHQILDSMVSDENKKQRGSAMPEPDEIFINRSKRVMSLIDTMIERKKRRRFERISGRAEPKTNSLEDQCAESEDEWSGDEYLDYPGFIQTQLPLEEVVTEEKRNHLQCLGLVSREEKNRLLIEQCEERMKIFSTLASQDEVSQDIERFYNTILKTGGTDVQLRIESDIKRNDLPLIEGLNRNTSRMKMSYMNCLGLEKRSKRTTLYKVKPLENFTTNVPKPIDLNNKSIKAASVERQKKEAPQPQPQTQPPRQIMSASRTNEKSRVLPFKFNFNSCREAIKPPSKNEYMRSLGLMAS